jgi:hypothetical protein
MIDGDISSYNSINKGNIRTSAMARFLQGLNLDQRKIYSNGSDSAWFILGSQIDTMPMLVSGDRLALLTQQYGQWPGAGQRGYLIWFKNEAYKESYATPEELSTIAELRMVYSDNQAAIYQVSSR